jgi:hypothetical protein
VIDYDDQNSSFPRHRRLRHIARRISSSTRLGVSVRNILFAVDDTEESERRLSYSWATYRHSRWFWVTMSVWIGLARVVGCAGVVMFVVDKPELAAIGALLIICAIVAAPVVPQMKKSSDELLKRALDAHQRLCDAQKQLETVLRQPFAPDPWAPLRATVTRSLADGGHEPIDNC